MPRLSICVVFAGTRDDDRLAAALPQPVDDVAAQKSCAAGHDNALVGPIERQDQFSAYDRGSTTGPPGRNTQFAEAKSRTGRPRSWHEGEGKAEAHIESRGALDQLQVGDAL